jgi:glutamate 5-kinase
MDEREAAHEGEPRPRRLPPSVRRYVIKLGTQVLTSGGGALDESRMAALAAGIASLRATGSDVVLVSSGAVAAGVDLLRGRVPLAESGPRPTREKQALAAVGQAALIKAWRRHLDEHHVAAAQVLLTRFELEHRTQHFNARNTLEQLLRWGVVPIINENDTTATEELNFGDNDGLAALVATTLHADLLVILTEVAGVFDADPTEVRAGGKGATAARGSAAPPAVPQLLADIDRIDDALIERLGAARGSRRGRGGIASKLGAARRAAEGGIATVIATGANPTIIQQIAAGDFVGTIVRPAPSRRRLNSARVWLASETRSASSRIVVNEGAARALRRMGSSLLPIGIVGIEGAFGEGEAVRIVTPDGVELGKGIASYGADALRRILGRRGHEIAEILGYTNGDEAVHRDALLLGETTLGDA